MTIYGLIGFPLGHSFSLPYFTEKFKREGVDAEYRNYPLEDIREFEELIGREKGLAGLNVTIPYKQEVIPYLDALNRTAREIGAVNTIRICRKDTHMGLVGHNTDVEGFRRSLEEHLGPQHKKALVLGTGGSSKAVVYVLAALGIRYRLVSRNKEGKPAGVLSYYELDDSLVKSHALIINTTPLGMHPEVDRCPDLPYGAITKKHLMFDLVYNPAKTLFLSKGEEQGAAIVNGYDMLVYQAEASWEIWNR
jgi:shikimate dehydrogenase